MGRCCAGDRRRSILSPGARPPARPQSSTGTSGSRLCSEPPGFPVFGLGSDPGTDRATSARLTRADAPSNPRATDILLEVDDATRFTEAFTHLRTGSPCRDRIGLLNVLLAEGINLGLRKMAEATTTHGFWELMRIARWHVEGEAYDRALSMVVTPGSAANASPVETTDSRIPPHPGGARGPGSRRYKPAVPICRPPHEASLSLGTCVPQNLRRHFYLEEIFSFLYRRLPLTRQGNSSTRPLFL